MVKTTCGPNVPVASFNVTLVGLKTRKTHPGAPPSNMEARTSNMGQFERNRFSAILICMGILRKPRFHPKSPKWPQKWPKTLKKWLKTRKTHPGAPPSNMEARTNNMGQFERNRFSAILIYMGILS